jgi:endonuclease YncB( thermonuclease family)
LIRAVDGDTPNVEQPLRLVSCDTPEKAQYAGGPDVSQPKLDACKQRLQSGFYSGLQKPLRNYLIKKLTSDAAANHISGGLQATTVFEQLIATRLTRPNGTQRRIGVIPTGEIIDRYARMLAYIVPWFANTPADPLPPKASPERLTFNLNMIENGWAAFFPIYRSLPADDDMNLAITAAEAAWNAKRGVWKTFGKHFLLGYEYRMCIKLALAKTAPKGIADAFQRACVDLRTLKVVGKFGFADVPPPYRLWVWQEDLQEAISALGLTP